MNRSYIVALLLVVSLGIGGVFGFALARQQPNVFIRGGNIRENHDKDSMLYGTMLAHGNTAAILHDMLQRHRDAIPDEINKRLEMLYINMLYRLHSAYAQVNDPQNKYIIRHGKDMRSLLNISTKEEFLNHPLIASLIYKDEQLSQMWQTYNIQPNG